MKVLFDCAVPFSFAHGGQQIQIEQTQSALERLGVIVEPLRWWDEHQYGDIFHFFGRAPTFLLLLAKRRGLKVVSSALEGGLGAKPPAYRLVLKLTRRSLGQAVPALGRALSWESFRLSDASIALTSWEAHLLKEMFQADPSAVYTIPNGVEEPFLKSRRAERGPRLVCTATIIELKQVLKLAQAAVVAKTPLWFIGKPYSETEPYYQHFLQFVGEHKDLIRYEGAVTSREKLAAIYREARGFVLLSKWESLSLSALEAAACECPLFLSDLPWARGHFGETASFCPAAASVDRTAQLLKAFHKQAPELPIPATPLSWTEVAQQLKSIYERLLSTSR